MLYKNLLFRIRATKPERGSTGTSTGMTYDIAGGCQKCRSGAKQTSPLRIKSGDLPSNLDVFETYNGEFLFNQKIAVLLMDQFSLAGSFRQAEDAKYRERLNWWQAIPTCDLPRYDKETTGIELSNQCLNCARDGHFRNPDEPFCLRYKSNSFLSKLQISKVESCDAGIYATYELVGNSGQVINSPTQWRYAQPWIVIGYKIAEAMRDLRVRGLDFDPVEIVD